MYVMIKWLYVLKLVYYCSCSLENRFDFRNVYYNVHIKLRDLVLVRESQMHRSLKMVKKEYRFSNTFPLKGILIYVLVILCRCLINLLPKISIYKPNHNIFLTCKG